MRYFFIALIGVGSNWDSRILVWIPTSFDSYASLALHKILSAIVNKCFLSPFRYKSWARFLCFFAKTFYRSGKMGKSLKSFVLVAGICMLSLSNLAYFIYLRLIRLMINSTLDRSGIWAKFARSLLWSWPERSTLFSRYSGLCSHTEYWPLSTVMVRRKSWRLIPLTLLKWAWNSSGKPSSV
jgi:hypothetical protein